MKSDKDIIEAEFIEEPKVPKVESVKQLNHEVLLEKLRNDRVQIRWQALSTTVMVLGFLGSCTYVCTFIG